MAVRPLLAVLCQRQVYMPFVYLVGYLVVGAVFYTQVEQWTFIDSMYFAVVTMSTVGYGDLDASTTGSKLFTAVYMAFGVLVVYVPVSKAIAGLQAQVEERMVKLAEERKRNAVADEETAVSENASQRGDFMQGAEETLELPSAFAYYARGIIVWLFLFFALLLASAAVYASLEPGWGYGNAVYHCWVTATTVGYGWNGLPAGPSQSSKAWTAVYILLSTSLLATTVGHIASMQASRSWQLHRRELLQRQLDTELIESLDTDGNGVDKLEFVVGM